MATKTKKLSELELEEVRFLLKRRGFRADGDATDVRKRLRKVLKEELKMSASEGSKDEKTASTDNRRNVDGLVEQKEEYDLEVVVDDFGIDGGGYDNLKEGLSKAPETGDKGREERKERENEGKQQSIDAPKPISTLWISGLTPIAKASDLKVLFSEYGQVNAAKVMASSKVEGKCYGLVTMSSPMEAQLCIQNVNSTQFQDNLITVEFDPKQRGTTRPQQPRGTTRPQQQTATGAEVKQSEAQPLTSLWISGLPTTTKAADLKEIFGKFGEVVHAKVAASKNAESKSYFGIVTMATSEEADACVENLNQTEIKGNVVTVEKKESKSKATSSLKPEKRDRSPPYERDQFYDRRGGFRGRRFSPRPYMSRGRASGFRGRGRDAFMYMDQIRADYEYQMERGQHGNDDDWQGSRGRGRYPGRSRPFDRSWDDSRDCYDSRGISGHEPYWGQAAKRPRQDDDLPPRDRPRSVPADNGRRGFSERGSWGGSGNHGDSRNPSSSDRPVFGAVASERREFETKSDDRVPLRNTEKQGGSIGGSGQWHSTGNPITTNDSAGYQAGPAMHSNYSQSYPSGVDSSVRGSYVGPTSSSFVDNSKSNTFESPVGNPYSSTGSNSYGGASSNSFRDRGGNSYGEAGGNSFGGTGSASFGATGSGSLGAMGSFGEGIGSFEGASGSSYGRTSGNAFEEAGSSSFRDSGVTNNSSYGGTAGGSFVGTGSSYGGTAGSVLGGSTYGGMGGSSLGGGGGTAGSSFRETGANSLGGSSLGQGSSTGVSSFGVGGRDNSCDLTGGNSYVGKECSSYGGSLHSLYSAAGSNLCGGVETSQSGTGGGSYGGSLASTSLGTPGNSSSFTASGSGSYAGTFGNAYGGAPGGGSFGSSGLPSFATSSSSGSFGTSSYSYSTQTTTGFGGSSQHPGGTNSSFTTSGGGGYTGTMNAPQSQYSDYKPQGSNDQSYPWY